MERYNFNKSIDIKYAVDTVVVGGGTAGCFAAISAARNGAKTILIEKNGILGGTMTVGGINFPGLFFAWGRQIIAGPCWESILKTVELGGAVIPEIKRKPERHWHEQIRLNKAIYSHVLDKMCEDDGVKVLFHIMPSEVIEDDSGITVLATGKEGLFAIRAKNIVDATGDADIVNMLGYEFDMSKVQQPATITNKLAGYEFENIDVDLVKKMVSEALDSGKLYNELTPDAVAAYLAKYNLDIHIPCKDCADSYTKGKLEAEAREKVVVLVSFLKNISGLENIYAESICDECGVRETRRIKGVKTVTVEDYIEAKRFDDAVCYAFYPVDLHVMNGIEQKFLEEDAVPTIPFGALIPKNSKRVLVCGRSVSSDNLANSALRVQAPCMAMGQAAGCAAALMSRENKESVNISYSELCESLEKIGAIVPEK